MLLDGAVHDAFFARSLVDGGEEGGLLIVVMLRNTCLPGETITNKVIAVGRLDAWSLLVDAVEATDEGIMAQGHVGCLDGERV